MKHNVTNQRETRKFQNIGKREEKRESEKQSERPSKEFMEHLNYIFCLYLIMVCGQ